MADLDEMEQDLDMASMIEEDNDLDPNDLFNNEIPNQNMRNDMDDEDEDLLSRSSEDDEEGNLNNDGGINQDQQQYKTLLNNIKGQSDSDAQIDRRQLLTDLESPRQWYPLHRLHTKDPYGALRSVQPLTGVIFDGVETLTDVCFYVIKHLITDANLETHNYFASLQLLSCFGCTHLTDWGMRWAIESILSSNWNNYAEVRLQGCRGLSGQSIAQWHRMTSIREDLINISFDQNVKRLKSEYLDPKDNIKVIACSASWSFVSFCQKLKYKSDEAIRVFTHKQQKPKLLNEEVKPFGDINKENSMLSTSNRLSMFSFGDKDKEVIDEEQKEKEENNDMEEPKNDNEKNGMSCHYVFNIIESSEMFFDHLLKNDERARGVVLIPFDIEYDPAGDKLVDFILHCVEKTNEINELASFVVVIVSKDKTVDVDQWENTIYERLRSIQADITEFVESMITSIDANGVYFKLRKLRFYDQQNLRNLIILKDLLRTLHKRLFFTSTADAYECWKVLSIAAYYTAERLKVCLLSSLSNEFDSYLQECRSICNVDFFRRVIKKSKSAVISRRDLWKEYYYYKKEEMATKKEENIKLIESKKRQREEIRKQRKAAAAAKAQKRQEKKSKQPVRKKNDSSSSSDDDSGDSDDSDDDSDDDDNDDDDDENDIEKKLLVLPLEFKCTVPDMLEYALEMLGLGFVADSHIVIDIRQMNMDYVAFLGQPVDRPVELHLTPPENCKVYYNPGTSSCLDVCLFLSREKYILNFLEVLLSGSLMEEDAQLNPGTKVEILLSQEYTGNNILLRTNFVWKIVGEMVKLYGIDSIRNVYANGMKVESRFSMNITYTLNTIKIYAFSTVICTNDKEKASLSKYVWEFALQVMYAVQLLMLKEGMYATVTYGESNASKPDTLVPITHSHNIGQKGMCNSCKMSKTKLQYAWDMYKQLFPSFLYDIDHCWYTSVDDTLTNLSSSLEKQRLVKTNMFQGKSQGRTEGILFRSKMNLVDFNSFEIYIKESHCAGIIIRDIELKKRYVITLSNDDAYTLNETANDDDESVENGNEEDENDKNDTSNELEINKCPISVRCWPQSAKLKLQTAATKYNNFNIENEDDVQKVLDDELLIHSTCLSDRIISNLTCDESGGIRHDSWFRFQLDYNELASTSVLSIYWGQVLLLEMNCSDSMEIYPFANSDETYNHDGLADACIYCPKAKVPLYENLGGLDLPMKCEALDIKTPSLICAATIDEFDSSLQRVHVHFDGWFGYDYWVSVAQGTPENDLKRIHPVGWVESYYKNAKSTYGSQYKDSVQAPKHAGYDKKGYFDWTVYLNNTDTKAIPMGWFTELQRNTATPYGEQKPGQMIENYVPRDVGSCQRNYKQEKRQFDHANYFTEELDEDEEKQDSDLVEAQELGQVPLFAVLPSTVEGLTDFSLKELKLHFLCYAGSEYVHFLDQGGQEITSTERKLLEPHLQYYTNLIEKSSASKKLFPSLFGIETLSDSVEQLVASYYASLSFSKVFLKFDPEEGYEEERYGVTITLQEEDELSVARKQKVKSKKAAPIVRKLETKIVANRPKSSRHAHSSSLFSLQQFSAEGLKLLKKLWSKYAVTDLHWDNKRGFKCPIHQKQFDRLHYELLGKSDDNDESAYKKSLKYARFRHNYVFNNKNMTDVKYFTDVKSIKFLKCDQACLSEDLNSLSKLTKLTAKKNYIEYIPDKLALKAVSNMDLSDNCLQTLSLQPFDYISLTFLDLANNRLTELPEEMGSLLSLQKMDLRSNCLSKLPNSFKQLLCLEDLQLSGVPYIPNLQKNATIPETKMLVSLATREINAIDIAEEEMNDYLSEDDHNAITMASKFEAKHIFQKVPRFGLNGSYKTSGGFPIADLPPNLINLTLDCQAIRKVPSAISKLEKLERLSLNYNPLLTELSGEVGNLPLKSLSIQSCLSLKTPPKEVERLGFHAVMGYLSRLAKGSVPCRRTKLMMVGLGGAGKTSLVESLMNTTGKSSGSGAQEVTDGIDIVQWTVNNSRTNGNELKFSVWDFAGQTVYYNTHQVIKSELPAKKLKAKYKQIVGFHLVSSYEGKGIRELADELVQVTLEEPYMGENIPEVWLNFEKEIIKKRKDGAALLLYREVEEIAAKFGILKEELKQTVKLLHELGTIQHFQNEFLKTRVVINPQWIVDVMSCIVSVHENDIKDGKMLHSDIPSIWPSDKYPAEWHEWLLRLTEEFDLTFPLKNENASLVPCLLPDVMPDTFEWPVLKKRKKKQDNSETKMIYSFDYLPPGLFNRVQVRLYQFSDSTIIWKNGSVLRKNDHLAMMSNIGNNALQVKVQGPRPENMLFLVHEVIETLINESFHGVEYDFQIPCADCLKDNVQPPCMLPGNRIRRAINKKAPFLQCVDNFHTLSITELQGMMPPNTGAEFDLHLDRTVRDLSALSQQLQVDACLVYCNANLPKENEKDVISPERIGEDLSNEGFQVFVQSSNGNLQETILIMKVAKVVVFCVSNEFVKNETCRRLFAYATDNLKTAYQLVVLGKGQEWLKSEIGMYSTGQVFINMQKASVYNGKFNDLKQVLFAKLQDSVPKKMKSYSPCFISYAWTNSAEAVQKGTKKVDGAIGWGDPRRLKEEFESAGIECWMDIEQVGRSGLFADIADGLRHAKIVVACISDEYVKSVNCSREFRFASVSLDVPIVLAVVGTGESWMKSEIGMLALERPKVSLQYANPEGLRKLMDIVQSRLADVATATTDDVTNAAEPTSENAATGEKKGNKSNALKEMLELAQRKFLRQLSSFVDRSDLMPYPRLLLIDFLDQNKSTDENQDDNGKAAETNSADSDISMCQVDVFEDDDDTSFLAFNRAKLGIRVLCECEEGWHMVHEPMTLQMTSPAELGSWAPYLTRLLMILKHTSLELDQRLVSSNANSLKTWLENSVEKAPELRDSYEKMYSYIIQTDRTLNSYENMSYGGLARCHLSNGKTVWLCETHRSDPHITILGREELSGPVVLKTDYEAEFMAHLEETLGNEFDATYDEAPTRSRGKFIGSKVAVEAVVSYRNKVTRRISGIAQTPPNATPPSPAPRSRPSSARDVTKSPVNKASHEASKKPNAAASVAAKPLSLPVRNSVKDAVAASSVSNAAATEQLAGSSKDGAKNKSKACILM